MRLLQCLFPWRRPQQQKWIDVLVDIDDTLVYAGDGILYAPELLCSYHFAHGALEFLIALDRIPGVRIGFYSCGAKARNETLIQLISASIKSSGHTLTHGFVVFSVSDRMYGKKRLADLRDGIDLSRAILVDDAGVNIEAGEEANLLKVYANKSFSCTCTHAQEVYQARLANNLVRALGIILKSIKLSKLSVNSMSVVQALQSLQWDGDKYLHDPSNEEEIYKLGLQAMQEVQPDFQLAMVSCATHPWAALQANDETLFPQERTSVINSRFNC
ncbi:hypothetical protein GOP47_0022367 [Adiantum capillus-veneris]|uniref:Uncharacterized protein n=1 Tax=Adiantum capillus-veneris TaxID=13818 RepID=A0A9D4U5F7_ADICA|nr:hypothetical protein GOP47_0022367 [Adiantum capillus-veneris]